MKTYKTWEVVKLLGENPNLKFETTEVYSNKKVVIFNSEGYIRSKFENINKGIDGNVKPDTVWTIIQEPVDFMTAFNSRKQIKPVCLDKEKSYHPYIYWLGFMVSCNAYKESPQPLDLINGKWYIEE